MKWYSSTAKQLCEATGLHNPFDAIAKVVRRFIAEVGLDGPPYDLRVYASFRGISRIEEADLDCDGELLWSRRVIRVNGRHSPGRQRFSVAHEIVHTLIDEIRHESNDTRCFGIGEYPHQLNQDSRARRTEEELLCNHGAAELLMPMQDFIPRIRSRGPSVGSVLPLAEEFHASKEAIANRIPATGLWPCASVVWEPGLKPCQFDRANTDQMALPGLEELARPVERLRVRYAIRSETFDLWIPRHKSVPEDTTIHECYRSGDATQGTDLLQFGRSEIEKVYVESIPIGFYDDQGIRHRRVLSLLFRAAAI